MQEISKTLRSGVTNSSIPQMKKIRWKEDGGEKKNRNLKYALHKIKTDLTTTARHYCTANRLKKLSTLNHKDPIPLVQQTERQ